MTDPTLNCPTLYLLSTDARFFSSLWQHSISNEPNAAARLSAFAQARVQHHTRILTEQAVHTADVCLALSEQQLSMSLGFAPILAAQAQIASAKHDIESHNSATWMRLTPVHWAAACDHVNLHPLGGDSVDASDWAQIATLITPWLEELGWEVFVHEQHAFIRAAHGFDYHAPSLAYAQSDMLEAFLPHGTDLKQWQTLLTEFQMLLHAHPINQARSQRGALPINSLWLDQCERADVCTSQMLTDTRLSAPPLTRMDYESTLSEWANALEPIRAALAAGHPAKLRIVSDMPDACVHTFEFRPASAWQKLRWSFKSKRIDPKEPPFAWLAPALIQEPV